MADPDGRSAQPVSDVDPSGQVTATALPEVAPPEVAPPEVAPPEVAPPEVAPPDFAPQDGPVPHPAGRAPLSSPGGRADRLRDLSERARELDFFQVLRRMEALYPDRPRLGTAARPLDEPVRIGQTPSLAFAPSTVEALTPGEGRTPSRLTVQFQGMFGPNGPLPIHLTEYARDRLRNHGDATLVRFADLFHHRLMLLFYRTWAQADPAVNHDRPATDRFATYVGALFGGADPTARNRDDLPDSIKLSYAGLLAGQTKHADGLRAIVADYLGVRTTIEECVGEWVSLPEESRWKLGDVAQPGRLGQSAALGGRVWMAQHKFRVVLGPLTADQQETLRPGSPRLKQLASLVANYVGDELRFDVKLLLHDAELIRLGQAGHLGWSAFLGPTERARTAGEVLVDPEKTSRGAALAGAAGSW